MSHIPVVQHKYFMLFIIFASTHCRRKKDSLITFEKGHELRLFRSILQVFKNRGIGIMLLLGFSSGLPSCC